MKQIFLKLTPLHFRLNHRSCRNHPQSIHHHHHPPPHLLWYRLNKLWVQKMTSVWGLFPVQVSQGGVHATSCNSQQYLSSSLMYQLAQLKQNVL